MITNRIMEYLEGPGRDVDLEQLTVATGHIRASLQRNLGVDRDTGSRKVRLPRPSGTFACPRRMIFDALGLETEGYGWRARMTFTHGDMTEAMGVLLFRQAMAARGESDRIISPAADGEQLHLSAMLDPADYGLTGAPIHLQGSVDMSLKGHGDAEELVDWKSSSRYAFQNMQAAITDPDHKWWKKEERGYIAQVRLYMMMARKLGRGPQDRGYLVFVCKDTGHVAECAIERDDVKEADLIRVLLWARENTEHAHERRAIVLEGAGFNELDSDAGNAETDAVLEDWTRKNIPRPQWATDSIKHAGASRGVQRPDGTKGPCLEIDTNATPNSWRCNYCPHTARCFPDFAVVALSKPVWRTNNPPNK